MTDLPEPHVSHAFHGGVCLGCVESTSAVGIDRSCPTPFDAAHCDLCDGARILGSAACPCAAMLPRKHFWAMAGNPKTACDLWLGDDLEALREAWTSNAAAVTCHRCLAVVVR